MDERIVVCLAFEGQPAGHAERVRALNRRASAFGATLCASGWEGLAFAFHYEDVEEAVEFVAAQEAASLIDGIRVGIAKGALEPLIERGMSVELSWGPALADARTVAGLAKAGEILLERRLHETHGIAISSAGVRAGSAAGSLEAIVVAVTAISPTDPVRQKVRLGVSAFTGQRTVAALMAGEPGTLATVRAAAGMGGTRLLRECALAVAASPALLIVPRGAGVEPLGSLRWALAREVALGRTSKLPPPSQAALASLLEGSGASVDDAAELLEAWLSAESPGLLLVDDAGEVDASTLEVIATSLLGAGTPFRAIVRMDAESPLPAVLALLPPGPEVSLAALTQREAESAAASWLEASVVGDALRAEMRATQGVPLALGEWLSEGLSSGTIVRVGNKAELRKDRRPGTGDGSAASCVRLRLEHVSPAGRAILCAVAVLGGEAPSECVSALVESAADVPVEFADEVQELLQTGWLEDPDRARLALPSRSHRRFILASLRDDRRSSWHRAASLAIETHGQGLAYAEAAWHAAVAGDDRRAARLAADAAKIAAEAKLDSASKALAALAASPVRWHPEADTGADAPGGPGARTVSIPPAPDEALAARLVSHGRPAGAGDSYLPVELPDSLRTKAEQPRIPPHPHPKAIRPAAKVEDADTKPARGRRTPAAGQPASTRFGPPVPGPKPAPLTPEAPKAWPAVPPLPAEPPPLAPPPRPSAPALRIPPPLPAVSPAPAPVQVRESFASLPALHVDDMAGRLPMLAREALQSGNEEALEQWVAQTATAGKGPRLLERMRAISALRTGDRGKALTTLRDACEQARNMGAVERSRSHLALAVGLAEVGKATDALIEGLEALSRARQASDARAELACLRFLQWLYERAGQAELAAQWAAAEPAQRA